MFKVGFNLLGLSLGPSAGVAGVTGLVVATAHKCFCWIARFVPPVLFMTTAMGRWAFDSYRMALLAAPGKTQADSVNVFELEQSLLLALGVPRKGEVQWDVVSWFLAAGVVLGLFYFVREFKGENYVRFIVSPLLVAAALAGIGVVSAIRSISRRWAWRPEL